VAPALSLARRCFFAEFTRSHPLANGEGKRVCGSPFEKAIIVCAEIGFDAARRSTHPVDSDHRVAIGRIAADCGGRWGIFRSLTQLPNSLPLSFEKGDTARALSCRDLKISGGRGV
jgi:hypothetical protein